MPAYSEGRVHCKFCGQIFNRKKVPFIQIPVGKVMRYAHPNCYKNAVAEGKIEDGYEVVNPEETAMCRVCLKPVVIGSANCHQDGASYFHESCFVQYNKQVLGPKEKLYDYLMSLCGWEAVPPGVQKYIEQLVSKENMSYDNIRGTLTYWYTIKGQKLNKENPVGIVPYAYHQAKEFYQRKKILKEKNKDIMGQEKIQYITIRRPKIEKKKSKYFAFLDEEETDE